MEAGPLGALPLHREPLLPCVAILCVDLSKHDKFVQVKNKAPFATTIKLHSFRQACSCNGQALTHANFSSHNFFLVAGTHQAVFYFYICYIHFWASSSFIFLIRSLIPWSSPKHGVL